MRYKIMFASIMIVCLCMVGRSGGTFHVSFEDAVRAASVSLKEGNAKKLAGMFDSSVNLSIKQEEGAFTKFQAELLLLDFFRANKVQGLKEVQRAHSSTTSFVVFSLRASAKNYRAFIKFIPSNTKDFKIAEVRIE